MLMYDLFVVIFPSWVTFAQGMFLVFLLSKKSSLKEIISIFSIIYKSIIIKSKSKDSRKCLYDTHMMKDLLQDSDMALLKLMPD